MKLFCTTLQLRFTSILCKSRRPTAKSWQRVHAGAAVAHAQPCEGRGTSRAPCWCHPAGKQCPAPPVLPAKKVSPAQSCWETDTSLLCRQTSDSWSAGAVWACRLPRHPSHINFNVSVLTVKNYFFTSSLHHG